MSKGLVVKDNALINASYSLDLAEQRLILLAIIAARKTGKGITPNDKLEIVASSYMDAFNTSKWAAYEALKDACDGLFEREFSFIENGEKGVKVVRSRWVSRVAYIEKSATVELTFAPDVVPLITLLEQKFTSYDLEQVAGLKSKYAVRLYEIVIAWKSSGKTNQISVEELRNRLGVLNAEYATMANFKTRVLDLAVKQINAETDINLTYEQHKRGRSIVGFTFAIQPKPTEQPEITRDNRVIDMFTGLTDQEQAIVEREINAYLQALQSKGETITELYRTNITNKAIAERWGLVELEQKQAEMHAKKELQAKVRAEKERQEQAEQERQETHARKVAEIDYIFENIDPEHQDLILDEVAKMLEFSTFKEMFNRERAKNKAHKHPMFTSHFCKLLGIKI